MFFIIIVILAGLLDPFVAMASLAAFVFWRNRAATIAVSLLWKSILIIGLIYLSHETYTPFKELTGLSNIGSLWLNFLISGYFQAKFVFWLCTKIAARPWATEPRLLFASVIASACVLAIIAAGAYRLTHLPITETLRPELRRYVLGLSRAQLCSKMGLPAPGHNHVVPYWQLKDQRHETVDLSWDDLADLERFFIALRKEPEGAGLCNSAAKPSLKAKQNNHGFGDIDLSELPDQSQPK